MRGRLRQSAEHVSPVGDDGDQPRHRPAALQFLRGESGPTLLPGTDPGLDAVFGVNSASCVEEVEEI